MIKNYIYTVGTYLSPSQRSGNSYIKVWLVFTPSE